MSRFYKIIVLVLLLSMCVCGSLEAQVRKFDKVKKVGKCIFNIPQDAPKQKYKKDKGIRVVFSDRADNMAYKEAYFQRKHSLQGMLTPFFVLEEKNEAYRLVVANDKVLGTPKGFWGLFMGAKYRFKDVNSPEYVGWISKDKLLFYDHSERDVESNRPVKYIVGINDVKHLTQLANLKSRDSVYLYNDPLLKKKSKAKVALNQIVYPYKKDSQGKTVLISNFPTVGQDSVTQVYGWLPAAMLHSVGSGVVYKKTGNYAMLGGDNRDSLVLHPADIHSKYLYSNTFVKADSINEDKLIAPISIWDQAKSKLVSLKGTDITFSEIDRMEQENKVTNIHLIVDKDGLGQLGTFVSAFQNIWMLLSKYKEEGNATFSFAALGNNETIFLNKTKSFADWLAFVKTAVKGIYTNDKRIGRAGVADIIRLLLPKKNSSFESNVFIIMGEREHLLFQNNDDLKNLLASNSSKILFVKPSNDDQSYSQNYILNAKKVLSETEVAYKDFIKGYMVDNDLFVKSSEIESVPSEEDNIYIYKAPKNSLFNGGIVFPGIGEKVLPLSLETALDSVLWKAKQTDSMLVHSLREHEKEVGVLTGWASTPIRQILKKRTGTSYIGNLSRSGLKDVFLSSYPIKEFNLDKYEKGILLTKSEIKDLIDNYRMLLPRFANRVVTDKNRKLLKKTYRKECKSIRKKNHRRIIRMKDGISKLFFFKTGMPFSDEVFRNVQIKSLRTVKPSGGDFSEYYFNLLDKLDKLEKNYKENKFTKVDANLFFVPIKSLL